MADQTSAPATKAAAAKKTTPAKKTGEGDPALTQFPALAGAPDVEIAERSADVHERASSEHRKVFVVQADSVYDPAAIAADDDLHKRNIDAMRQAAILQGLRPTSDGQYVGSEVQADGVSVELAYSVDVVPASIATPEESNVAVLVEDNRRLQAQTDGQLDERGRERKGV